MHNNSIRCLAFAGTRSRACNWKTVSRLKCIRLVNGEPRNQYTGNCYIIVSCFCFVFHRCHWCYSVWLVFFFLLYPRRKFVFLILTQFNAQCMPNNHSPNLICLIQLLVLTICCVCTALLSNIPFDLTTLERQTERQHHCSFYTWNSLWDNCVVVVILMCRFEISNDFYLHSVKLFLVRFLFVIWIYLKRTVISLTIRPLSCKWVSSVSHK